MERVLNVEKGKLCYVVGTVYMDMPIKPNIIEDIARDVRLLLAFVVLPRCNGLTAIDRSTSTTCQDIFTRRQNHARR